MNREMTYETMDWEAEAKRVARAFGVEGECEFRQLESWNIQCLHQIDSETLRTGSGVGLGVYYSPDWQGVRFVLGSYQNSAHCEFDWNGNLRKFSIIDSYSMSFARALFHLDLLTPEVEAALQVSISHHQKLEWALEYDSQNPSP